MKKKGKNPVSDGTRKSASFQQILTRNVVFYTLLIVLTVAAVFLLGNFLTESETVRMPRKNLLNYTEELSSGRYSDVPAKKLFGANGYLQIFDTSGHVVYSTLSERVEMTEGELDVLMRYAGGEKLEVSVFETTAGKENVIITKKIPTESGGEDSQYMLLDSDLNIISGTVATNKTKLTRREFELMTYNFYHGEEGLYRYSFKSASGEDYIAVILDTVGAVNRAPQILIGVSVAAALILYAVILIIFIRSINKKVKGPLGALDNAMNELASDNYRVRVDYKGAAEFEKVTESFNNMVEIIDAGEKERAKLEDDKRRMLSGLSHDLKTPVTVIQGFAKAIKDGLADREEEQKYLDIMIDKSDRLAGLIDTLNEYNRLEHPDFTPDKKQVDLAETTRRYLASKYGEFELNGCALDTDIPDAPIDVCIDEKQFLRVYENLSGNVFKYNPGGARVKFKVAADGEYAYVSVSDSGVGIIEESRENIFNPFVVGDESRKGQGSGLGLAICRKIAELNGGTIELTDTPEEGYTTEFVIKLPLIVE